MAEQRGTQAILGTALRRDGRPVEFRRGQTLFVAGDLAERVFLIEQGYVLLSSAAPGGREIVLAVSGPGDVIGELSAFDREPRSATALAVDDVHAVVAASSVLTRALEDIEVTHELIRVLSARLREGNRKQLEFATLTTLGRVAWRLLELGERYGEPTSEGIAVQLPLSQDQLASWCAASREATVKALRALRSLQIITTGRRSVVIRDAEALRRQANGLA